MSGRQTSLDDVIHCRMPLVSTLTPFAAKGMSALDINSRPTTVTYFEQYKVSGLVLVCQLLGAIGCTGLIAQSET